MITNIKPIQPLQNIYQSDFFSPVRTGVDFLARNLTGLPLVGTIASGIGSLVDPMSPRDQLMQSKFSVGANPQLVSTYGDNRSGNMPGQDPYGINTVSAFGNYPVYAQEKVAQLAAKGNLTPFQQQKLEFYQDVIDEETARIDRDYPGGTTFDFAEYEQDTNGGNVTTTSPTTTEGRAAESYYDL
jgi:hypothetical protein